jgi:hypothetical protein
VEAAEEDYEAHVGDDNEGDNGEVVHKFVVSVARALREFAAAATGRPCVCLPEEQEDQSR